MGIVRDAVCAIPNTMDTDRDEWLAMAHRIKGAVGPKHSDEGYAIFTEWSVQWPGGRDAKSDDDLWRSIKYDSLRTGWRQLRRLAEQRVYHR